MYMSLRTADATGSPRVVSALLGDSFPAAGPLADHLRTRPGGSIATLLALDLAANTTFTDPAVYTYGSPPRAIRSS